MSKKTISAKNGKLSLKPKGRRNIPNRLVELGRHLVYSEGTKTEPYYVENIKKCIAKSFKTSTNEIEIIIANEKSYNTVGLVEFALKDVDKRIRDGEMIDHVWIMFDKDDFPLDKFKAADKKINDMNNSSKSQGEGFKYNSENEIVYHSCYSNQCFELWLLLYFCYLDTDITRPAYIEKLEEQISKKIPGFKYEKNKERIHSIITEAGGKIENAIRNAKKLVELNKLDAPSTAVYLFAEYMNAYMEK